MHNCSVTHACPCRIPVHQRVKPLLRRGHIQHNLPLFFSFDEKRSLKIKKKIIRISIFRLTKRSQEFQTGNGCQLTSASLLLVTKADLVCRVKKTREIVLLIHLCKNGHDVVVLINTFQLSQEVQRPQRFNEWTSVDVDDHLTISGCR